jgi:hypothetical protein
MLSNIDSCLGSGRMVKGHPISQYVSEVPSHSWLLSPDKRMGPLQLLVPPKICWRSSFGFENSRCSIHSMVYAIVAGASSLSKP